MKKTLNNFMKFLLVLVLVTGCQEDDLSFGDTNPPSDLQLTAEIVGVTADTPNGDGSGLVNIKASAKGAMTYQFKFNDGTQSDAMPKGEYTQRFTQTGTFTYVITAIAYGSGGSMTSKSINVTVYSSFSDPETVQKLTGGTNKTWYWFASKAGHLGVGPNEASDNGAVPQYYAAGPFEKSSGSAACFYQESLVFTKDGDNLRFKLNADEGVFFNASFNSVGGSTAPDDQCLAYDTSADHMVSLMPTSSLVAPDKTMGTTMDFNGGFMGYYIGTSRYEILKITDTELHVRAVMGGNPALAWYHIFTTKTIAEQQAGNGGDEDYTDLFWSDEFDTDGAPDATKWTYDLGTGENGWGNNEQQYYRQENAVVEGGNLKITAKSETFGGKNYTSARLKTEGLFDFTYGRVEIRAKLATGSGTWPALWMLGANYQTQPWPKCGEIDIMEHVGNNQDHVLGTLHMEGNSGGNGISGDTTVAGASTDFHIYELIWSPTQITWKVDGTPFHTYANTASSPFNADFFLIMNVAMGGNLGGTIAPGFVSSTMEVDYVKVFK
ncbi:MAG: laminarinase [Flavobacterium psychrophilum]|nr:MAG: laminarinase [Flavobacterium psychrophilum]